MALIDPSTDLGRMRLKLGDTSDLPQLPDSVYTQTLLDTKNTDGSNNVKAATSLCGQYILANLAFSSHKKLQMLEIWGSEAFDNYKSYLTMIIKDTAFSGVCPIAYVAGSDTLHPILQHQQDFYNAQTKPTSDEKLHSIANDASFDPYSGEFVG